MAESNYKYKQLKNAIVEAIRSGALAPGDRVEPELSLMQKYGLSRNTVRQALLELETEQQVCRTRGRGTFVRSRPPARIAFFMQDAAYATYPLNSDIIRGIDSVLGPARYALAVTVGAFQYNASDVAQLAADCAGVLIATNALDPEIPRELQRRKIPFRLVKNYHPGFETSAIRFNFEQAGALIVEHLAGQGARRLALFGLDPDLHCTAAEFQRGILLACPEFGIALPAANRVNAWGKSPAELVAALATLEHSATPPDAIVCGADEIAFALMDHTRRPTTGCNDLPEAAFRKLTTVHLDGFRLGECAARAVLSDIAGQSVHIPPLEVTLRVR